ncbi:hypothetical protein [Levilactobacillus lindianensis]|uniref:hypothetical protein n=1 Tax=Levilactobacillus lindianensis TaxID=2486018 RepID=UPI000F736796|nr:hypothetical protein [Levilactobacillus lindianensis]
MAIWNPKKFINTADNGHTITSGYLKHGKFFQRLLPSGTIICTIGKPIQTVGGGFLANYPSAKSFFATDAVIPLPITRIHRGIKIYASQYQGFSIKSYRSGGDSALSQSVYKYVPDSGSSPFIISKEQLISNKSFKITAPMSSTDSMPVNGICDTDGLHLYSRGSVDSATEINPSLRGTSIGGSVSGYDDYVLILGRYLIIDRIEAY